LNLSGRASFGIPKPAISRAGFALTGVAESGKKIQLNERLAFRIGNDQANGAQPVQPMFSARGGTQRWLK